MYFQLTTVMLLYKLAAKLAAGASYADAQGWEWRILSYREKGGASFTSN